MENHWFWLILIQNNQFEKSLRPFCSLPPDRRRSCKLIWCPGSMLSSALLCTTLPTPNTKVAKGGWRFEFEFEPSNLFGAVDQNKQELYPNISKYIQDVRNIRSKYKMPSGSRPGPSQRTGRPGPARPSGAGPAAAWYFVLTLYILDMFVYFDIFFCHFW